MWLMDSPEMPAPCTSDAARHLQDVLLLPISSILNLNKLMSMARQIYLNVFVIGSHCATSEQGDAQKGGASRRGAGGRRVVVATSG
jgi:hypothetical protein